MPLTAEEKEARRLAVLAQKDWFLDAKASGLHRVLPCPPRSTGQTSKLSWSNSIYSHLADDPVEFEDNFVPEKKTVLSFTGMSKKKLEPNQCVRSVKFRLAPTKAQIKILHRWFAHKRAFYNETVKQITKPTAFGCFRLKFRGEAVRQVQEELQQQKEEKEQKKKARRQPKSTSNNNTNAEVKAKPKFGKLVQTKLEKMWTDLADKSEFEQEATALLAEHAKRESKFKTYQLHWEKVDFVQTKTYILDKSSHFLLDNPKYANHALFPRDGKDMAVKECCDAVASTIESIKAVHGKSKPFDLRFKSAKDLDQSFRIPCNSGKPSVRIVHREVGGKSFPHVSFWPKAWGKENKKDESKLCEIRFKHYRENKKIQKHFLQKPCDVQTLQKQKKCAPDNISTYTATIKFERPGFYYLILQYAVEKQTTHPNRRQAIAFDPGIRTFQTGYDSTGSITEYGVQSTARFMQLARQASRKQSKAANPLIGKRQRKKLKRQMLFKNKCAEHLRQDFHHKVAKEMCEKYQHVMIPAFGVERMVRKDKRNINKEVAKRMLKWGHFQFRQFLMQKGELLGCHVHEVDEAYTTKTCGMCGWQPDGKFGGTKIFKCPKCGFRCDRDHNAARNIFLKNVEKCLKGAVKTTTNNNNPNPGCSGWVEANTKRPKTGELLSQGKPHIR